MTKQMIEVDVPDGWQVERVSPPVFNGCAGDSGLIVASAGYIHVCIRSAWQWPKEWLFRWAAKHPNECIGGFNGAKPIQDSSTWYGDKVAFFLPGSTTFDIPGLWQDSLRENPNWEGGE